MEPIDHLDLVVSDVDRSLAFYTELLRPFGYDRSGPIADERGERVVYVERPSGIGSISVRERQSELPLDRYAVGLHHLAFRAPDRATVDERAAWLREHGHTIESGPQEHAYAPGYYAVFFYDPDGIKLEIVHRPDREVA
jgi:glyoxylase I family protein